MRFGSVCSGIEAASVAWEPIGWKAAWFAEIEPFPCAVLKHHYPDTPNRGDMNLWKEWPDAAIDVLCGGTPCQSFSVAGLRKGLDDPRGNLMLTFLAIAKRHRPRWLVWENVPGVLSSNGGRDFGSFLGGLAECGYGFAYRVLDAQYFGLAQRRKRVFVVAHLGDWRPAAAVLFERESLCGHPAPRREAGQAVAGRAAPSSEVGVDFQNVTDTGDVCGTLMGEAQKKAGQAGHGVLAFGGNRTIGPIDVAPALNACGTASVRQDFEAVAQPVGVFQDSEYGVQQYDSAGTLRAGRIPEHQMVMQPIAFHPTQSPISSANGTTHAMGCGSSGGQASVAVAMTAMRESGQGYWMEDDIAGTLRAEGEDRPSRPSHVIQQQAMQVRRLTPVECERLQGFQDGYTAIPWRNKPASECPDGPRYKALGNSWAVPVVRWIGERINLVESVLEQQEVAA